MKDVKGVTSVLHVLLAGVSTRAAAESAARAGFAVTAIDAFGDLDQHPAVRILSPAHNFSAHATALSVQTIECDAVVYLASFENHPKAISTLAEGRVLWGNSPTTVRRVRDPQLLAEALRRRGFAVPQVRLKPDTTHVDRCVKGDSDPDWLVKPLASGGGLRIRKWDSETSLPRGCYLQEFVDGPCGSVVFVAAGGRAVPLCVSRQLVGEPAFGAEGYQYCASILAAAGDPQFPQDEALMDAASALARAVAEEYDIIGVNGIDFVAREGVPYPIEVNPRWCASMELVERAYGLSVFDVHASACSAGVLPEFDLGRARRDPRAVGKAVVYARRDVTVGETRMWLTKHESIRDIPRPGSRIPSGQPVCTIFADARDAVTCHDALVRRAECVYSDIAAWERGFA